MHHPTDRITHTMTFVMPVVEHWLERESVIRLGCHQVTQNISLHLSKPNGWDYFSGLWRFTILF